MLKLVEAEEKYLDQYQKAYEEALEKINNGEMKRHDMMFMDRNEVDIIQKFKDNRDKDKLPKEYVPSYDYFLVDDDTFLGVIMIRVSLTDDLLNFGGNIGYGIRPYYWRQGYGTKLLELGLIKAKELIDSDKVLITCDDDNIGSYSIIEKNGGILENKVMNREMDEEFLTRRYWIKLK